MMVVVAVVWLLPLPPSRPLVLPSRRVLGAVEHARGRLLGVVEHTRAVAVVVGGWPCPASSCRLPTLR